MQKWLDETLRRLNRTTDMNPADGFSRLSYSPEEGEAHQAFREVVTELGLEVKQDEAGNQWAMWHVADGAQAVGVGSHLDTVYNGGGYDGAAGVLTGLAAIKLMKDEGVVPTKNIAVICFASEESARFGVSTIGSKAITGLLDQEDLADIPDREGQTIREVFESFGLDWDTADQAYVPDEGLESFLELHIEQGTEIEDHQAEVGIVRGIACPIRLKVTVRGMANHTGTTPMPKRQDALASIAPLISYVEEEALRRNEALEKRLVATVSTVAIGPNAMNVIPGEVELGIDIRSVNDEAKRQLAEDIRKRCGQIAIDRNVQIEVETLVDNDSVALDETMQKHLVDICESLSYEAIQMDSGAGHDVMNMAVRWPSGLIFIPCKEGISHHPAEYASVADLEKGSRIIAEYLRQKTGDVHENQDRSHSTAGLP
ncbi:MULTISPECIES: M20 family metallo-hydrolase [Pontibacillus]|uniref:M20 family metallo-hydrolase n=1 Tax=Pontibacillus chungwhensis TaxID=265426 RepID=A0ABY8UVL4_9BACI|nr:MULTISPECIES: M20 family metallo-hydrolase [Pontibacillus]MCD5324234.1 M20 family metallo-hydrolase [Pontibacillus sp. HN14]WIF97710.1 M20 family metallo-hydrolase [Pontibacillus chungwhensis]